MAARDERFINLNWKRSGDKSTISRNFCSDSIVDKFQNSIVLNYIGALKNHGNATSELGNHVK